MRQSIVLKDEKGQLTQQYRAVLDGAKAAKRDLNTEEKEQLNKMDARFEALDKEIALHEKQEARESEGSDRGGRRGAGDPENDAGDGPKGVRASKEYQKAFGAALVTGKVPSNASAEIRMALQSDLDDQGGVLVASEQFADRFIQAVDNQVFIRGLATVTRVTTAASLGIPTLASDIDDANWTAEIATGSEDTGMKFGKRELRPHPLAKRIKLSKKLLRLVPMVENKVMERLAYKFGIAQENGFLTGNGVNQPLGLFTASTNGISTARDVSTNNTTTAFTADGLIDAIYSLKAQYQRTAQWIFHRDAVKMARKLKNSGTGEYIWQPGLQGGQPDRILDRPFNMSEFAPNTFTTGKYVGIVGDFTKYEIADALDMTVQVLTELYAETNQNGYIGRVETDGMPVLEEAFARVTLA
jgi:HK97 family phage major capsid protein